MKHTTQHVNKHATHNWRNGFYLARLVIHIFAITEIYTKAEVNLFSSTVKLTHVLILSNEKS